MLMNIYSLEIQAKKEAGAQMEPAQEYIELTDGNKKFSINKLRIIAVWQLETGGCEVYTDEGKRTYVDENYEDVMAQLNRVQSHFVGTFCQIKPLYDKAFMRKCPLL